MASAGLTAKLRRVRRDLNGVVVNPSFDRIGSVPALLEPWIEARDAAFEWLDIAEPASRGMDDAPLMALQSFATEILDIGNGRRAILNEDIPAAIKRARSEFQTALPRLIQELLGVPGTIGLPEASLLQNAPPDGLELRFQDADKRLKRRLRIWAEITRALTAVLGVLLILILLRTPTHPHHAAWLLAAAASFTGLRLVLAATAALAIALAFSLRMTRACAHKILDNRHSLRTTKKLDAFVAELRTAEPDDQVIRTALTAWRILSVASTHPQSFSS